MGIFVCRMSELRESQAISRELTVEQRKFTVIVYAINGKPHVYLNSCPHTGVRLEWRQDDFMDSTGQYLMCAMHGALFQPHDGACIEGPCVGDSLIALETSIEKECLYVLNAQDTPKSARGA